jgi:hypothetical protein
MVAVVVVGAKQSRTHARYDGAMVTSLSRLNNSHTTP